MESRLTDRNLIAGVMALQLNCITPTQLIAGMQAWVFEKELPLEDLLLRQQSISAETCDFIKSIVSKYIELYGGSAAQSLASLSSVDDMVESVKDLVDPDLQASISQLVKTRMATPGTPWREASSPVPSSDATAGMPWAKLPTILIESPLDNQQPEELPARELEARESRSGVPQSGEAASKPAKSGKPRFRILKLHAKGGLGQVSLAEDCEFQREVALKELQPRFRGDPNSRARFLLEGKVTGCLEHPGIVPVYSLNATEAGSPFYVMRFIRGDSLKEAIDRLHNANSHALSPDERRLILNKLLRRLIDVCNAIEYSHSRGVLHRDLKPGNIMLGKYGETLVVDWGIAKTIGKKGNHEQAEEPTVTPLSGEGSSATQDGSVIGTLAFMSPEQARGEIDVLGPTSDVFCLGATLYSILTGQAPYERIPRNELVEAVRQCRYAPPRELAPQAPPALEAICLKAMSPAQANRYQSALELAEDLELFLNDEPVAVYREPLRQRAFRWIRRHQTLATTTAGVLTATLVAMLVIGVLITRQNTILTAKNNEILQKNQQISAQRDRAEKDRIMLTDLSVGLLNEAEVTLAKVPDTDAYRAKLMTQSFEALALLEDAHPNDQRIAELYAKSARYSANQFMRINQREAAIKRMQQSLDLQLRNFPRATDPSMARMLVCETYRDLGNFKRAVGQLRAAALDYDEADQWISTLILANPTDLSPRKCAANVQFGRIGLWIELDDNVRAEDFARRSVAEFLTFCQPPAGVYTDRSVAALAMAWHGWLLDELGRPAEAREVYAKSITSVKAWMKLDKSHAAIAYPYARLLHWNADGSAQSGTVTDEQLQQLAEALEHYEQLSNDSPSSVGFKGNLASAWKTRGKIHRLKSEFAEALAALDRSEAILRSVPADKASGSTYDNLHKMWVERAEVYHATNRPQEAIAALKEAIAALAKEAAMEPESLRSPKVRQTLEKRVAEWGKIASNDIDRSETSRAK